jgi:mRNA interferase RelE/StbE
VTGCYDLRVKESAKKELRKVAGKDLRRIVARMEGLSTNPRPAGGEKLAGEIGYRVRQGDYRVTYTIDDENQIVEIAKIGQRREIYR